MSQRVLEPDKIKHLLKVSANKEKKEEIRKPVLWPSHEDRSKLYHAARRGDETIMLGKRVYGIKYREVMGEEGVYIWPLDGKLVPCGEFRLSILAISKDEVTA